MIHFKRIGFEGASGWCYVALRELLWHSDCLANRSFCQSGISRVQLKSNWIVAERLLASYQEAVRECKLILLKAQRTFLMLHFKIYSLVKKNSVMVFLVNTDGTQKTLQTVRWLCEPVILSIGHFEGRPEVQLNSWWKTADLWSRSS